MSGWLVEAKLKFKSDVSVLEAIANHLRDLAPRISFSDPRGIKDVMPAVETAIRVSREQRGKRPG